ncbi:MAG: UDP-glucose 4-epimerase GalE [Capsulimonadales bacterium]|nr:UDP-glucose 4-epimerase GalE [Capsulimonadales bacterium]
MAQLLVTGGAGYIGSHVVRRLGEAGHHPVIYDNCSTGSEAAVLYGQLVLGDLADMPRLSRLFARHHFDAVLHFAASVVAPESVTQPLEYYANNTRNTLNLLQCCQSFGVKHLIFSSTAAVYGEPTGNPVDETHPTRPVNPYGRSKRMSEQMIEDLAAATDLKYVILRYFNVAGADPEGRLGPRYQGAPHLIKAACDAALGRRPSVSIYGTDYDTPDGTCIRDYIHVEDLAAAHIDALRYLENGGRSDIFNCGYGRGYSVRDVLSHVQDISKVRFSIIEQGRRPGDPVAVTACSKKIRNTLGWSPAYDDLDVIISTTLAWERRRGAGFVQ